MSVVVARSPDLATALDRRPSSVVRLPPNPQTGPRRFRRGHETRVDPEAGRARGKKSGRPSRVRADGPAKDVSVRKGPSGTTNCTGVYTEVRSRRIPLHA